MAREIFTVEDILMLHKGGFYKGNYFDALHPFIPSHHLVSTQWLLVMAEWGMEQQIILTANIFTGIDTPEDDEEVGLIRYTDNEDMRDNDLSGGRFVMLIDQGRIIMWEPELITHEDYNPLGNQ